MSYVNTLKGWMIVVIKLYHRYKSENEKLLRSFYSFCFMLEDKQKFPLHLTQGSWQFHSSPLSFHVREHIKSVCLVNAVIRRKLLCRKHDKKVSLWKLNNYPKTTFYRPSVGSKTHGIPINWRRFLQRLNVISTWIAFALFFQPAWGKSYFDSLLEQRFIIVAENERNKNLC